MNLQNQAQRRGLLPPWIKALLQFVLTAVLSSFWIWMCSALAWMSTFGFGSIVGVYLGLFLDLASIGLPIWIAVYLLLKRKWALGFGIVLGLATVGVWTLSLFPERFS